MAWPVRGLIVRVVPRRLEGEVRRLAWLRYDGNRVVDEGRAAVEALPGAPGVVLLLAPEDVVLTRAIVPPLSGTRLREALPNLVEDQSLADPATLHVAMGTVRDDDGRVALALVDRAWLRLLLERFAAAGVRVVGVYPEALCLPLEPGSWTVQRDVDAESGLVRCAVRCGPDEALALPPDAAAAQAMLGLLRERQAPTAPQLVGYGDFAGVAVEELDLQVRSGSGLKAWLESGSAVQRAPWSLLQHEFAGAGRRGGAARWRRVAWLVALLLVIQLGGMHLRWQQLRAERTALQASMASSLRAVFPETTAILDAPLQMQQGLGRLRAAAGRSDAGDFAAMAGVAGQVFASLQPNSVQALDYAERVLRVRLSPGFIDDAAARQGFVDAAQGAGYDLRFEPGQGGAGPVAVLRVRGGA